METRQPQHEAGKNNQRQQQQLRGAGQPRETPGRRAPGTRSGSRPGARRPRQARFKRLLRGKAPRGPEPAARRPLLLRRGYRQRPAGPRPDQQPAAAPPARPAWRAQIRELRCLPSRPPSSPGGTEGEKRGPGSPEPARSLGMEEAGPPPTSRRAKLPVAGRGSPRVGRLPLPAGPGPGPGRSVFG